VDLDEDPLEVAKGNADLNNVRVKFVQADAFSYLRDAAAAGKQWDAVVLDPPKLIRSRDEYEDGVRKHRDLNKLAFGAVAPGGLLLTCSCAGLLPDDEFVRVVFAAARSAGREVKLLEFLGAAPCHPVAPRCPESRYLKAAWLRVD
jgi:23S rRNA (cytosine1962-C5)-methyltransferase